MESPPSVTGPINLGNPVEFTMKQLAQLVLKECGSASELRCQALPPDDPKQRKPDISVASKFLGWTPSIPLEEGIRETTNYFRTNFL
jgi:UDP-glucuronate decarboxylase